MDDVKTMQQFHILKQILLQFLITQVHLQHICLFVWILAEFHQKLNAIVKANKVIIRLENNFRSNPEHRTYFIEAILSNCFLNLLAFSILCLYIKSINPFSFGLKVYSLNCEYIFTCLYSANTPKASRSELALRQVTIPLIGASMQIEHMYFQGKVGNDHIIDAMSSKMMFLFDSNIAILFIDIEYI
jgi:hypothetical protein